jgi:hypothetical protein
MCLDSAELEFYKYEGDLTQKLEAVRGEINSLAESWTAEQRQRCLDSTMDSFKVRAAACTTDPMLNLHSYLITAFCKCIRDEEQHRIRSSACLIAKSSFE